MGWTHHDRLLDSRASLNRDRANGYQDAGPKGQVQPQREARRDYANDDQRGQNPRHLVMPSDGEVEQRLLCGMAAKCASQETNGDGVRDDKANE